MDRINPGVFRGMARDLVELSDNGDLVNRIARLPMPVLYCHGTTTFADMSRAALYATDVEVREFPGAGHWLHREQARQFAEAVGEFLVSHSLVPSIAERPSPGPDSLRGV